jgi:parallel beta-helix repeat protein
MKIVKRSVITQLTQKRQQSCIFMFIAIVYIMAGSLTHVAGATYYVAKKGSDGNSGTSTSPFLTIGKGLVSMNGQDTLVISAGTYTESLENFKSGTSGSPTTIQANGGEIVIIKPNTGGSGGDAIRVTGPSYIKLMNLIIDGTNVSTHGIRISGTSSNVLVESCEVLNAKNANGNGIFIQDQTSSNNVIRACKVHDNGTTSLNHGIYVRSANNLIELCDIYANGGYGVHIYMSGQTYVSNNIVRKNKIHDNNTSGNGGSAGIILSSGENNVAYNNLIYGSSQPRGIQIEYGVTNAKVYNNTIYNQKSTGNGITIGISSIGADVKNNIIYKSGTPTYDGGVSTTIDHNLTTDPLFSNAAGNDFHLTNSSPAIAGGVNLSNIVADDLEGTPRPGSAFDLGAYQYKLSSSTNTIPPNNLRITSSK